MTGITWTLIAWNEFIEWQTTDKKTALKIAKLAKQCLRSPFEGDGKPEPLKHELAGYWSRRINDKDRLIYRVNGSAIEIVQCRTHYRDR